MSSLSVSHNGKKLDSDVSAAQIAIWNRGRQPIRRAQILEPIVLKMPAGAVILEATIRRISRNVTKFDLDRSRLSNGIVSASWDILEEGDGGIVQIIYAGPVDAKISGDGIVEGQKALSEARFSGRLQSAAEQYQEKFALLNCRRLPARLNVTEAAVLLGFKEHDIAPLVAVKLLVPLGRPAQNSPKYFATVDIIARAGDGDWLSEATRALARYWLRKNRRNEVTNETKMTL